VDEGGENEDAERELADALETVQTGGACVVRRIIF